MSTVAALVRYGVRDQRRSVLVWGGALGALGAFIAGIYPAVQDSVSELAESYPSGLREAFGVASMDTAEGYLHAELFSLLIPLAVGVFAIRSVLRPLTGAEERGELDTILALPLSRRSLVASALIVAGIALAGVLALTATLTLVTGRIAGTGLSTGPLLAGCVGVWPLAMIFAAVAVVAAGGRRGSGATTGAASGALVAMYAADLAGRLADALAPLRAISPFRYVGAPLLDGLDPVAVAGLTLACLPLAVAGALLLERRDIGR